MRASQLRIMAFALTCLGSASAAWAQAAPVAAVAPSQAVQFHCGDGPGFQVDFANSVVYDDVAGGGVSATITVDTVHWHYEFDTHQSNGRYGNQIVHHVADYTLDRAASTLNGRACTASQN